jgi:Ca2+-binding RTX toxin-like protein
MGRIRRAIVVVSVLAAVLVAGPSAGAAPPQTTFAYGLTASNRLVLFNVTDPGTILRNVQITGLQPGESLIGIDVRPATGQLYGIGVTGRVYVIDPTSGAATAVAPPSFGAGGVDGFGLDFNPMVDLIRLVSTGNANIRINPTTGAVAGDDTNLNYAALDPNSGADPNVSGVAYTNNFPCAASTILYGIDVALDILVIQSPANAGTLFTVGPLGVNTDSPVGFDIVTVGGSGSAYASLTAPAATTSGLYTINFATGAASLIGTIGGGEVIRDIAIATGALVCTVPVGTAGVIFAAPGGGVTSGTSGSDVICGTSGVDRLFGMGGHDLILGLGGNDQLAGGEGSDTIYGGPGNDQLAGGGGPDFLFGNEDNDDLAGGFGTDQLYGNLGTDRLSGGEDDGDFCRVTDGPLNTPSPEDVFPPAPSCELIA